MNLLTGINNETVFSSFEFFVAVLFSNTILFILCNIFIKLHTFYGTNQLPKYSWAILIQPFSTLVFILNIGDYFYLFRNNIILLLIILGLMISNFITIFIFYSSLSSIQYKNELTISKMNEKHYENIVDLLNSRYKHNFIFSHEILKKAVSLKIDFNENNYATLENEIDNLIDMSFKQYNMLFSNSTIVDALLNENIDLLNMNNIVFSSTLEFNKFTFLSNNDEFDLFQYIIKIAIQHSILSNKDLKNIILKSKKIHQQIIIEVLYPCMQNTEMTDEIYYDIESLTQIIKKYNGYISIKYDSSTMYSSLIILFPYV